MATRIRTERLVLVPLDPAALRHLIAGHRAAAERILGLTLPADFPTDNERKGFLPIQLNRMEASPERHDWMARLMASEPDGVVGHCGFHGPPEIVGRTEIGYTVFEAFRGRGFAKEAAIALVDWAFDQGESQVYACVAPDNAPSLAVVKALGLRRSGRRRTRSTGSSSCLRSALTSGLASRPGNRSPDLHPASRALPFWLPRIKVDSSTFIIDWTRCHEYSSRDGGFQGPGQGAQRGPGPPRLVFDRRRP